MQLLSNVIRSRIVADLRTNNQALDGAINPDELEEKVIKCLQMVDIDTVFDITGLWEVLGSIDGGAEENETELVFVDNLGVLISSLLSSSRSEGTVKSILGREPANLNIAYDLLATLGKNHT